MVQIRIQIIFKGHFIRILEYLNACAHHCSQRGNTHVQRILGLMVAFTSILVYYQAVIRIKVQPLASVDPLGPTRPPIGDLIASVLFVYQNGNIV